MAVRVLQLLSNPVVGGTETFLLGLIPRLRANGIDVTLLNMWDGGGDTYQRCQQQGCDCELLEVGQRRFRAEALPKLRSYIRAGQFDVVMAYGLRTSLLLRAASPSPQRGGPVRVTGLRGLDEWRRAHHVWADRLTERWMDYFVGVSRSVCRRRIERERTPPEKVLLIPNGIDTQYFRRDAGTWPDRTALGLPDGTLCVSVGNLRRPKGYPFQIEVISRLREAGRQIHFVWAGKGADEEMLRRLATERGVLEQITFYGHRDDVRPILSHATLFFLSSREEGMPRALMEAMAMGVPVIATDVGGVSEVVRDGIDGMVVRYGDMVAAAERIGRLIDDPALSLRFAEAGVERIRSEFSFDTVAHRYAELYKLLAARDANGLGDYRSE